MLGAIAGDIIGAPYEAQPIKRTDFPLFGPGSTFTDDTVCTVAVAAWLLDGGDPAAHLRAFVRRHPHRGYGGMFLAWAVDDAMGPYGSWGNGAPMRVSPVGWAVGSEAELLSLAALSAAVSHDHPDAVAATQAVAFAIWHARRGMARDELRAAVARRFGYDLATSLDAIRPGYGFDVSAKGTVPAALVAALEAEDYEQAVRGAVSLGGDADTLACITGGLAEVLHGLPAAIARRALATLSDDLRDVVERFAARFGHPPS